METYTCEGECTHDEDVWCGRYSPCGEWECTRHRGHSGDHVACSPDDCNLSTWPNERVARTPLTKEAAAGPITITISGGVMLEMPSPEEVFLIADASTSLTPDELQRLIRALVMAANLQRAANPKPCQDCGGEGVVLDADSQWPIQRCDTCEQFASDYEAWLSIIPNTERDEEEES